MDFHRQARPSVGLTCIYQSSLTLASILYAFAQKSNAPRAISFHSQGQGINWEPLLMPNRLE
jgi:hypothetical protein